MLHYTVPHKHVVGLDEELGRVYLMCIGLIGDYLILWGVKLVVLFDWLIWINLIRPNFIVMF